MLDSRRLRASKQGPDNAHDVKVAVLRLRKSGKLLEASSLVRAALRQHPNDIELVREAAVIAQRSGEWARSLALSRSLCDLGDALRAADQVRIADVLIRVGRYDEAHTELLIATSRYPAAAGVRSLALDLLRRQRTQSVEHDLAQLGRQYIRRMTTSAYFDADACVDRSVYKSLFLARSGEEHLAVEGLAIISRSSDRFQNASADDYRILVDLALRHSLSASAEALLVAGRERFPQSGALTILEARYLLAVRQPASAARLLETALVADRRLGTLRNRRHLVRALSSDDRVEDAYSGVQAALAEYGDDDNLMAERIKLICKSVDIEFSLTHIDPIPLEVGYSPAADLPEVASFVRRCLASPADPARLPAFDALRKTITTSLSIAAHFPTAGLPRRHGTDGPAILAAVFGDDSWENSELGRRVGEAVMTGQRTLDRNFDDLEPLLADPELRVRHPLLHDGAFERVVLWHGGLRLAHLINQSDWARRLALGYASNGPTELDHAVLSALQLGRRDEAAELLARLEQSAEYPLGRLRSVKGYFEIVGGCRDGLVDVMGTTITPPERQLRDYMSGKSVAIVAPAPGNDDNGAEIDSFDVVVRPNALGPPSVDESWRHGSRTDIVSFAATRARQLERAGEPVLDSSIRFALFKYKPIPTKGGAPAVHVPRHPLRHLHTYTLRQVNHLPQLIYYLSSFEITRLKIFNATFFLSPHRWEVNYVPAGRTDDVLSQLVFSDSLDVGHWFVQMLMSSGAMEVDEQARTVLNLDTASYMREMSDLVIG